MQHAHTAPRGLTRRRSRLWDSHATSPLTQHGEASENLSVIFNSQGNRRIRRSTNLLEKELRSGTLPGTGAGRLQTQPWRGRAALSTGAVPRFETDQALGWWVTASHDTDAQSGAFCPLLAEQSSACARSRLSHLRETTWERGACSRAAGPSLFKHSPPPSRDRRPPLEPLQNESTLPGAIKTIQALDSIYVAARTTCICLLWSAKKDASVCN